MAWYVVLASIWFFSALVAVLLRVSKRRYNISTYFLLVLALGLCYMKALSHWLPYCSSSLFDLLLVLVTVGVYPTAALREAKARWQEALVYLCVVAGVGLLVQVVRSLLVDAEAGGESGSNIVKVLCVGVSLAAYAAMSLLQGIGVLLYPEEMLQPLLTELRLAAEYRTKYEEYQEQIRSLLLYYTYRGMPMPAFKEKQFNELSLKADQFCEEASCLLSKSPAERLSMYLRVLGGVVCSLTCTLLALSYIAMGFTRMWLSDCGVDCGFRYTGWWRAEGDELLVAAAVVATAQVLGALAGFVAWMGRDADEDMVQVGMACVVGMCGLGMPSALHNLFPLLPGTPRSASVQLLEFSLQWLPLCTLLCSGWSRSRAQKAI